VKDKYLITLEIDTYDGDPREWDWEKLSTGEDENPLARERVMSRDLSWSELAELTHATQVEHFNFCLCEDNEGQENPYADCPKEGK